MEYGRLSKYPTSKDMGTLAEPRVLDTARMTSGDISYYNHLHDSNTGECVKNRLGPKCPKKKKR